MGANNSIGKIILFDGVCNLCSGSVKFIIKRDKKNIFRFASLQSGFGKNYLTRFSDHPYSDTIVLIDQNKMLVRSDAALAIAKELSGLWPLLFGFKIVPRFIRDFVYRIIAKKRYHWFGRTEECFLPTPELKTRFIE